MERTLDTLNLILDYRIKKLPKEIRRGDRETLKNVMDFLREPEKYIAIYLTGECARCTITRQGTYKDLEMAFCSDNEEQQSRFIEELGIKFPGGVGLSTRIGRSEFLVTDISNRVEDYEEKVIKVGLDPRGYNSFLGLFRKSKVGLYFAGEKSIPPVFTLLPAIDGNPRIISVMDLHEG